MTKPIKTRKKLLLFLAILYLFLGLFFHTGRMCFGESPLFSSFVYHLLSRQYPSFCTAVPIGQKNFVYRRRDLYPCSISASIYSFLDRNRMSDACRSAGSFKF